MPQKGGVPLYLTEFEEVKFGYKSALKMTHFLKSFELKQPNQTFFEWCNGSKVVALNKSKQLLLA